MIILLIISLLIIGGIYIFTVIYILFFRSLNRLLGGKNPHLKDIIDIYLEDVKLDKIFEEKVEELKWEIIIWKK